MADNTPPFPDEATRSSYEEAVNARFRALDVVDIVAIFKSSCERTPDDTLDAVAGSAATDMLRGYTRNHPDAPRRIGRPFFSSDLRMYWVSDEMLTLIETAAWQLPDDVMPSHLVSPPTRQSNGVAWFERPILSRINTDEGLGPVPIAGLAWSPCMAGLRDGKSAAPAFVTSTLGHVHRVSLGRLIRPYDSAYIIEKPLKSIAEFLPLPLNGDTDTRSMDETVRLTLSLLALLESRLVSVDAVPLARQIRRRAQRAQLPEGVRVVYLRRTASHSDAHDHAGVDWSHRWVVSGHWRNQPHGPGRQQRRLTWVAPHVKGPSDKPLVVRPTVNALVR